MDGLLGVLGVDLTLARTWDGMVLSSTILCASKAGRDIVGIGDLGAQQFARRRAPFAGRRSQLQECFLPDVGGPPSQ